jgi:asparagine synthase (glutamine-hydrolysing)
MCGFIGYTGTCDDNKAVLGSMLGAISHRGPDSEDTYSDEDLSLGFRRLSIIDVSGGSQPLFNEDRTKVLVFNGEIYNYKPLREDLIKKGHVFTTHTDSEVILHGYEEYGADFLKKLRGMFAFVIWDTKTKKMFAARDFFGIKPLYYARMGKTMLFGSEIKGFLSHPDFKKELFEEKLPDFLTFSCVPGTDTFFKNVYKLAPGHYMEYQNGELAITRYFTAEFQMETDRSLEYFADEIARVFPESVTAHEMSEVPVGCFLSSGVDSSYVAREVSKQGNMCTYTIGFDDAKYDESANVKKFAQEIKLENKTRIISSEEYFAHIGDVQYHLDEPLANPSANLLYFLAELASEDVTVVLSGEGADEMFGGYNMYKEPIMLKSYQKIPAFIRKSLAHLVRLLPPFKGQSFIIRGSQSVEERYLGNSNIFSMRERTDILKKQYAQVPPQTYTRPFYDKVKNLDDMTKMQYLDMHVWMVQEILLKADKMSMAHSLELRVPFLDMEIWKIARRIPPEYKVSKENTKLALRKAAGKEINAVSANRRKMAFPMPLSEWLREERYQTRIKDAYTSAHAQQFFNTDDLLRLLSEHKEGKRNNTRKIWATFTFLVWYEEYFIKR